MTLLALLLGRKYLLPRLLALVAMLAAVVGLSASGQAQDVEYALGENAPLAFEAEAPLPFAGPADAIQLANWQTHEATQASCEAGTCDGDWYEPAPACCSLEACDSCAPTWLDNLSFFGGIDGSKQPQDFGTNANLGGRASFNWGIPVSYEYGIGVQVGSAVVGSGNAVRVYELQGEATDRFQSFNTIGFFQRMPSGLSWGVVYDFLYERSYDQFTLGQWRGRVAYDLNSRHQVGVTMQFSDKRDSGFFNATPVTLDPITQGNIFWRTLWESGTQTTFWAGMAEGHGESNSVTGFSPPTGEVFLFGADILAPLNDHLALYGETNLMMPADTGCVDAYLGLEIFPWGGAYRNRRQPFSPLLPVAASTNFSVDLSQ